MAKVYAFFAVTLLICYRIQSIYAYFRKECHNEMFYLNKSLNSTSATARCIELGYDGLAVLKSEQQRVIAHNLVLNSSSLSNVWIGLEFNLGESIWMWRTGGIWLTTNGDPPLNWANNEPDKPLIESCVRISKGSNNDPKWKTLQCRKKFHSICHRVRVPSNNWIKLMNTSWIVDVTIPMVTVKTLEDYLFHCTSSCSCVYAHFTSTECRLLDSLSGSHGTNTVEGALYHVV